MNCQALLRVFLVVLSMGAAAFFLAVGVDFLSRISKAADIIISSHNQEAEEKEE
jgi:hypothetical protein